MTIHPLADVQCKNIGEGTSVWQFAVILAGAVIGKNCNIGQNVVVSPLVEVGNNVKIQNNVSLYTGVICEDDVFIGPSVVFTNVINPRSAISRQDQYKKTLVKTGASIGANATIVCGNTLGKFSFIGAGAVITKDVPDYALFIGNPAFQSAWMSEYGQKLNFDSNVMAKCPESNQMYQLLNGNVTRIS